MKYSISFGIKQRPISEQLLEQGYVFSNEKDKREIDYLQEYHCVLTTYEILSKEESVNSAKRILKEMEKKGIIKVR